MGSFLSRGKSVEAVRYICALWLGDPAHGEICDVPEVHFVLDGVGICFNTAEGRLNAFYSPEPRNDPNVTGGDSFRYAQNYVPAPVRVLDPIDLPMDLARQIKSIAEAHKLAKEGYHQASVFVH
jgi:hypothetical protein